MARKTRRTRRTRRTKGLKLPDVVGNAGAAGSTTPGASTATTAASAAAGKDAAPPGVKIFTSAPSGRTPMASNRVAVGTPMNSSRRVTGTSAHEAAPSPGGSRVELALWFIVFASAILTVVGMRSNRVEVVAKAGAPAESAAKKPGPGPGFQGAASPPPGRRVSRTVATASAKPGAPAKTIAGHTGAREGTWKPHRTVQRKKYPSRSSTFTGEPRAPVYGPPLGAVGDEVSFNGIVTANLTDGALVRVNGRTILVKGPGAEDLRVGAEVHSRGQVLEPMGELQTVQIEGKR